MSGINKVIIVGNLGQDVETKYTSDGRAIANISVATSDNWTDKNGERHEKTEWHRIAIFGKLAEITGQYLHKGSKVYVEGKLQTDKWTDKEGVERYTTRIIVSGFGSTLQMLDKKNNNEQYNSNANSQPLEKKQYNKEEDDDYDDDDIPF